MKTGTTWRQAVVVGLVQGMAVFPGLSRSGLTISSALGVGLDRNWAARFSFLLGLPAIAGVAVLEVFDERHALAAAGSGYWLACLIGAVAAGVRGLLRAHHRHQDPVEQGLPPFLVVLHPRRYSRDRFDLEPVMSRERLISEMIAVGLIFGSVLMAAALLSHSPLDPSPLHASTLREGPVNLAGPLGAALSAVFYGLFGIVILILPPLGLILGWRMLRGRDLENPKATIIGWALIVLALPGVATLSVFRHAVARRTDLLWRCSSAAPRLTSSAVLSARSAD